MSDTEQRLPTTAPTSGASVQEQTMEQNRYMAFGQQQQIGTQKFPPACQRQRLVY
jgi:hypothetical protein